MSFGRNYGFTLVELMTVVAIISIIAAIAIPILYETRTRAQVNSTIGVLRTISSGQQTYFASIGEYTDLQTLSAQKILDARFATVPVLMFGYSIDCNITNNGQGFLVTATPTQAMAPKLTVDESFLIVQS